MLYLFAFPDGWFKFGFTAEGVRERQARGFWHNAHPPELCGRLGEPELRGYWEGTWELEQALHSILHAEFYGVILAPKQRPPTEFYKGEPPLDFLRCVLEPLEAGAAGIPEAPRLRACCGGENFGFQRLDHAHRAYATAGQTAPCSWCGRVVSVRRDKLKHHQKSKTCMNGRITR